MSFATLSSIDAVVFFTIWVVMVICLVMAGLVRVAKWLWRQRVERSARLWNGHEPPAENAHNRGDFSKV